MREQSKHYQPSGAVSRVCAYPLRMSGSGEIDGLLRERVDGRAAGELETRGQLRTALVSVVAAGALVVLKLGAGLVVGGLGLVSAGIESSGDVVAAVLTPFAVRLGARPADAKHPYGHRRAENLAALGGAAILTGGGLVVFVSVVAVRDIALPDAHELASRLEDDIREGQPHMTDVVVHTEP
jgi:divalent metal cation (Fe/Co/Zn/Cd) transporter